MSPSQPPDIEIAQSAELKPIEQVAASLDLAADEIDPYGRTKAKITGAAIDARRDAPDGDLVLVTAITPTPAGEGKTTTTIGLTQALQRLGHRAISATREPSLGPVFGVKGGAAGGGYAQVLPMEDINLHFTGDFAAISAAHNLLAAMLDNHLHQGNALGIDSRRVLWRRVIDMNDRALHSIVVGLGGRTRGVPRESGFDITPASEVMAVLCLARDLEDLKARFARIAVAERRPGDYVTAADLSAHPAMAILMREAVLPNLVQNLEGGPALIHGGPFGNIAHGCNSLIATQLALKLADLVVTEAGFGADLGAEKFFNIKCPAGGLRPRVAVLVATVRALKLHGGASKRDLVNEDLNALRAGLPNLEAHAENLRKFGVPVVIAVNRFPTDTDAEVDAVMAAADRLGATGGGFDGVQRRRRGRRRPGAKGRGDAGGGRRRLQAAVRAGGFADREDRGGGAGDLRRRRCGLRRRAWLGGCVGWTAARRRVSRYVWPRRSTRCRTARRCWGVRAASESPCGTYGSRRARASWCR